jgi:cellulose synthase/poly-beta-1,6-N-acetylglucosamine synthase-like glycosyltransferase
MTVLFWFTLALLAYVLAVYPMALFLWSRFKTPHAGDAEYLPFVSVLVPLFNEEGVLAEKLANCLALDYPPDRLEIVFASDGSTDGSVALLRQCRDPRVCVVAYPVNRGKSAVLNETIPRIRGEIAVLTDASGLLNAEAVRHAVGHFKDPDVGCVCGVYRIAKEGRSRMDSAESSYLGFEMGMRIWEGRIRTTLSGTGALCAIRASAYDALPAGAINDDFIVPARIALKGFRVIYETRAHVQDRISTPLAGVFRRRVRIAYGNLQQVAILRGLLNPRAGYLAWIFYSHKLLRTALPYLLIFLLVSAWWAAPRLAWLLAGALGAGLLLGVAGILLDRFVRGHNPLAFLALVLFNCVAVLVGSFKFLAGQRVRW